MLNKRRTGILILVACVTIALVAIAAKSAGGMLYSAWQDSDGNYWVKIGNDTGDRIQLIGFSIVFHKSSGEIIERREIECKVNCRLLPGGSKDFGPIRGPDEAAGMQVTDIRYVNE